MRKTAGEIKQFIGEDSNCDFKEFLERKQFKSWLKSVSAFANGYGGSLLFGMNDQGAAIGLGDAKGDAEFISDKVKTFMDPVPEFELKYIQPEEDVNLLELRVHQGNMPPYYFVNSGSRIAFVRIGDESVIATSHQLSSLVLKGRNVTYDSLPTEFRREDVSFHKLGESYEKQIDAPLLEKLLHSFSLITTSGMLTNAGVLFSDQCHYRHSSLYCTR